VKSLQSDPYPLRLRHYFNVYERLTVDAQVVLLGAPIKTAVGAGQHSRIISLPFSVFNHRCKNKVFGVGHGDP